MQPSDPIQAASHADPYPYYAALAARPGLAYDAQLKLWVAADAATVRAVLTHPDCRVRPLAEPVPAAIAGAAAGHIFSALVRMNDGARHARPKLALQRALGGVDLAQARARAHALGRQLWCGDGLTDWMLAVPVSTVASLIGFEDGALAPLAAWMAHFVACLSPLSSQERIAGAHGAAAALLDSFTRLLRQGVAQPDSLLARVRDEAAAVGWDDAQALLANLVGLLSQTYEATAGLLGNSVLALLRQPDAQGSGALDAAALVQAVSRLDPAVQNTRRFVARGCTIGGVRLEAGQAILVLLAAASGDPAGAGQAYGFGHGPHACPGHALACAIATGALEALLEQPLPAGLAWRYRPSVNARIPVLFQAAQQAT
jgi:cytochrome P450